MAGALSGVMTTVVMAPGERIKSLLQVRGEFSLELPTNLREVSQCPEKAPTSSRVIQKLADRSVYINVCIVPWTMMTCTAVQLEHASPTRAWENGTNFKLFIYLIKIPFKRIFKHFSDIVETARNVDKMRNFKLFQQNRPSKNVCSAQWWDETSQVSDFCLEPSLQTSDKDVKKDVKIYEICR